MPKNVCSAANSHQKQHPGRYGVRLLDGRSIKIRKSAFDLLRDGEVIESPRFDSVPNSPHTRGSTPSSTSSRSHKATGASNEPPPLSLSGEDMEHGGSYPGAASSSYAGALQHRNRQRRIVKPLYPHINNYDDGLEEDDDEEEEEEEEDREEDSEDDEEVLTTPCLLIP